MAAPRKLVLSVLVVLSVVAASMLSPLGSGTAAADADNSDIWMDAPIEIVVTAEREPEIVPYIPDGWFDYPSIDFSGYFAPPSQPTSSTQERLYGQMYQGKQAVKEKTKKDPSVTKNVDVCGRSDWTAAIPDYPLGFDFTAACIEHDRCRAANENDRAAALACHEAFNDNMDNWCWNNIRQPDLTWAYIRAIPAISMCLAISSIYWEAVVLFNTPQ